jgi:hypothetical protein
MDCCVTVGVLWFVIEKLDINFLIPTNLGVDNSVTIRVQLKTVNNQHDAMRDSKGILKATFNIGTVYRRISF